MKTVSQDRREQDVTSRFVCFKQKIFSLPSRKIRRSSKFSHLRTWTIKYFAFLLQTINYQNSFRWIFFQSTNCCSSRCINEWWTVFQSYRTSCDCCYQRWKRSATPLYSTSVIWQPYLLVHLIFSRLKDI